MDWLQFPFNVPNNNQVVWVRIDRYSGAPFLAQYKSQQQKFTSQLNLIDYPVYSISVWRPQ